MPVPTISSLWSRQARKPDVERATQAFELHQLSGTETALENAIARLSRKVNDDPTFVYRRETKQANRALLDLLSTHHQATRSERALEDVTSKALDAESITQAREAVDKFRHFRYKLLQSGGAGTKVDDMPDALGKAYEAGQSWLLDVSRGSVPSDIVLWQFRNRKEPSLGSRSYWPPTHRVTKTLEPYLSQKGRAKVMFDTCGTEEREITVDTLREENRRYAIHALQRAHARCELTEWERGFLNQALRKSYGIDPVVVREDLDAALEETFEIGSDSGSDAVEDCPQMGFGAYSNHYGEGEGGGLLSELDRMRCLP